MDTVSGTDHRHGAYDVLSVHLPRREHNVDDGDATRGPVGGAPPPEGGLRADPEQAVVVGTDQCASNQPYLGIDAEGWTACSPPRGVQETGRPWSMTAFTRDRFSNRVRKSPSTTNRSAS